MSLIKVNQLSTLDGAAEAEVSANTGLKIPSTASLKVEGDLLDSGGAPGAAGQYLISNGTNVVWSNLPQDLDTNANVTFNNVTVEGDITITGNANFNLNSFTTDDLIEGSNQYYTNLRARQAISVSNVSGDGFLGYNSGSGLIEYTGPSETDYRAAISTAITGAGDGSIAYDQINGVVQYEGPEPSDYRAAFGAIKFDDGGANTFLGDLTFDQGTGDYTYTGPTVAEIRSQFSATSNLFDPDAFGQLGFDPNTGIVSYEGITAQQIRDLFNADTPAGFNPNGLTYDDATGTYYIDPGAIDPALIYAGINTSPTSTAGDINDSIQNLHVNNATFQQVSVSQVVVAASGLADVSAAGHTFIDGDRVKLVDTENAHLDGIYEVLTSDSSGPGDPGTTFQVQTTNVTDGTYSPAAALTRRVSVFTGDLVVDGSINVNGSKIGLSDLFVGTSLIRLNSDLPDSQIPANDGTDDAFIEVNRGAELDTALRWNEGLNRWQFSNDGINYNNILLPSETDFGGAEEFGASGDPDRYNALSTRQFVQGASTFTAIEVSDISKFKINQQVKVFGVSSSSDISTSNPQQPGPAFVSASTDAAIFSQDPSNPNDPLAHRYYAYATAQMDINTGDIAVASVQSVGAVENIKVDDLNETNYNVVRVTRGGTDKATLLYRAVFADDGTGNAASTAISGFTGGANTQFELIAVIGPRYFENNVSYDYNDYGNYDVTVNSRRDDDGTYGSSPVHVPHTASLLPKQGFVTSGLVNVDPVLSEITLATTGLTVDADLSNVFAYHDDTLSLQNAIANAQSTGRNFLVIPGGTYLVSQLLIPDGFTLKGLSDATVLHKQYWDTTNMFSASKDGIRGAMIVSENYDFSDGVNAIDGGTDIFFGEIILDGNSLYQILDRGNELGEQSNDCLINLVNSNFVRLQSVKIRYSAGPALYATGSTNLVIDSAIFFDGAEEERFETPCLIAEEGDTTVISNSIFRDFPGPLILNATEVLAVNGCTVRNCGSGLRVYASKKTDVLNNLILGPADEYIPVPDQYDSEFNSVNLNLEQSATNDTPVLTYLVSGDPVDLTGCVRRVEVFRVTVTAGEESFDVLNPILNGGLDLFSTINDGITVDPSLGQTQFRISSGNSAFLYSNYPTQPDAYNVYRAYAIKYLDIGSDIDPSLGTGELVGSLYKVICNAAAYNSVVPGDYIKLFQHSYAPEPTGAPGPLVWLVQARDITGPNEYQLDLLPYYEESDGDLVSYNITSVEPGGGTTVGGGYIGLRDKFIIAKGVISITV